VREGLEGREKVQSGAAAQQERDLLCWKNVRKGAPGPGESWSRARACQRAWSMHVPALVHGDRRPQDAPSRRASALRAAAIPAYMFVINPLQVKDTMYK